FPVVVLAVLWNEFGPAGFVGLALVCYLFLRWRRGRRARKTLVAAAAAAAALVVVSFLGLGLGGVRQAHAQAFLDENEMKSEHRGPPVINWAFEFKLGPYYPDVDGESGLTGKPFETLFGTGSSIMGQIELDRFFFHVFGQLGLGVSV